ncbi:MAG: Hsp20/alpha crystallin family protein [Opitutales bacterium]|jgi:HSP20 family protein|nr:Hsp20/alpha crystallin family protein [Opitutales bacterium]MDP4644376.1 Hsp20/alpha crystallin family protein [Opitutales bacterium]MDP4693675.1 Hsp20/alpha crystallin family protein [Opitutales bacterium]MDP4777842.1 Hsp20/alpha crystallin family protein [Opitutales bacterium]MDP4878428.1 Hsp20/alpha crystallin family protein [Opitutales bacterium]
MKLIRYEYPQSLGTAAYDNFFHPAAPALGRLGSLFDDLFGGSAELNQTAADLYEDAHNYYARLELPGVKKKEIDLELENSVLTISGATSEDTDEAKRRFSFQRSISVPDGVALDRVSASHEDGILTVTMPKVEVRKPRQITVK